MDLRRRSKRERSERQAGLARPLLHRATHWSLWALVAFGAVGGLIELVRPSATTVADVTTTAMPELVAPPEVTGYAELAARRWVDAHGDGGSLDSYFIEDVEPVHVGAEVRRSGGTAVVATRSISDRYWAVTVAVDVLEADAEGAFAPVGTWYVEIGIVQGDHPALAAVDAPALVPAPASVTDTRAAGPNLRTRQADDPVAAAVEGLLAAMLTGSGDLTRYLAPDATLAPVTPPPFASLQVEHLASTTEPSGELVVRVLARATSPLGHDQLVGYELVLLERAGRWEASSLTGAPTVEFTPSAARSTGSQPAGAADSPAPSSTTFPPPVASPGA